MAKTVLDLAPGGGTTAALATIGKVPGDRRVVRKNIAADANYPAGGYPIAAKDLGFGTQIDYLKIINGNAVGNPGLTYWFWNRATQSLQLIVVSTGVETAVADQHLSNVDIEAEGF